MSNPWDVPRTEAGRDELIRLVDEFKQAGKDREAGICLLNLAHVYKHVGAPDGRAFDAAAEAGAEAIALLRQAGDKRELARALRLAAVPFSADCAALLNESLALARQIGDVEEEAWTIFRMNHGDGVPGHTHEEALALFEECGSLEGQASCLRSMGFKIGKHNIDLLKKSIELFEQAGNAEEAERGRAFLDVAMMPEPE
jgi:hypothetical protein